MIRGLEQSEIKTIVLKNVDLEQFPNLDPTLCSITLTGCNITNIPDTIKIQVKHEYHDQTRKFYLHRQRQLLKLIRKQEGGTIKEDEKHVYLYRKNWLVAAVMKTEGSM